MDVCPKRMSIYDYDNELAKYFLYKHYRGIIGQYHL